MGLGGHLLWTSVVRSLNDASGKPVVVGYAPGFSDLVRGRLCRTDRSLASDPVFAGNPRIEFPQVESKPLSASLVDRLAGHLLRIPPVRRRFERAVARRASDHHQRTGQFVAHVDLQRHSYVARERRDRLEWKSGGHIVQIIAANFGVRADEPCCEMYFTEREEREADAICRAHDLRQPFLVIEPYSKEAWFGDLRMWPLDRWQGVVDALRGRYRIVQIGEGGRPPLEGVLDLSGRISFRMAALVMKRSRLFLGLDGGLMNAATAVGTPAVIVWGGTSLPEFAGYPHLHSIICRYVECAPCGLRGVCPYDKKCMTAISPSDVLRGIDELLRVA